MNEGWRVRRFVVRALEATGSRVEFLDEETAQVELSSEWCRRWRCSPRQVLAFARDSLVRWPEARLMAPGSDWLADLIAWGREKGKAGGLFSPIGLDPACVAGLVAAAEGKPIPWAPPAAQEFARALSAVRLADVALRLKGWRLVYQRQILFAFRVSFLADAGEDAVVQVLIDPVTEEAEALPGDVRWSAFPPAAAAGNPGDAYRVRRLYRSAQRALPRALRLRWSRFCAEVAARYEQERVRLQAYYEELELQAREPVDRWALRRERERMLKAMWGSGPNEEGDACAAAAGTGSVQLESYLRAYESHIAEIREERERRLRELRDRYAPRAVAQLVYGAMVVVPRVEVEWRTGHPRRRYVTAFFDLMRGRWVDWRCEACGRSLRGDGDRLPHVTEDGAILCPDCLPRCGGCGKPLGGGKALAACHLCERSLCEACCHPCGLTAGIRDQAAGKRSGGGLAEAAVCPECRALYCNVCLAMARSGTGSGPAWEDLVGEGTSAEKTGGRSVAGVTRGRQKIQAAMVSFL